MTHREHTQFWNAHLIRPMCHRLRTASDFGADRADGFVGAVTMVGPDATEASVKKLATQAYQYAAQTLG